MNGIAVSVDMTREGRLGFGKTLISFCIYIQLGLEPDVGLVVADYPTRRPVDAVDIVKLDVIIMLLVLNI